MNLELRIVSKINGATVVGQEDEQFWLKCFRCFFFFFIQM